MADLSRNEYMVDVKQVDTVKIVEHVKDITVLRPVEKELEVPKIVYRDVPVERPVYQDKVVEVEKVRAQDLTSDILKVIEEKVDELVRKLLEKIELKVSGSGNFKLEVRE